VRASAPTWWGDRITDPFGKPPELVTGEDLAKDGQGEIVVSAWCIFSKSRGESRSDLLSDPMAVSKTALLPLPQDIEKIG